MKLKNIKIEKMNINKKWNNKKMKFLNMHKSQQNINNKLNKVNIH